MGIIELFNSLRVEELKTQDNQQKVSEVKSQIAELLKKNGTLKLSKVFLSEEDIRNLCDILIEHNISLTTLNLSGIKLLEDAADKLANFLSAEDALVHLNLSGCDITGYFATRLVKSLKNKKLKTLELAANNLGGLEETVNALKECIATNPHLEILDLSANCLKKMSIGQLAHSLATHPRLKNLDLGDNWIGDDAIRLLVVHLIVAENKTLKNLGLNSNCIEEPGLLVLAEYLKINSQLMTLEVCSNEFSKVSLIAWGKALKNHPSLLSLRMCGCSISSNGLSFIESLAQNTHLKFLELSSNDLDSQFILALARVLQKNKILEKVTLSYNAIPKEAVLRFVKAWAASSLKTLDIPFSELDSNAIKEIAKIIEGVDRVLGMPMFTMDMSLDLMDREALTLLNAACDRQQLTAQKPNPILSSEVLNEQKRQAGAIESSPILPVKSKKLNSKRGII